MPFDPTTAKPVEASAGGFDPSTAKPVEDHGYDMSEYSGNEDSIDRLARKAKAAVREIADKPPAKNVTAEDVRNSLMTRKSSVDKIATGVNEGVLSLASGLPAAAVGGIAGLAGAMIPGPEGQGARWAQGVQGALTYEPRSDTGKAVAELGAAPLTMAGELAGKVGAKVGEAVDNEAAGRTIGEASVPIAATLLGGRGALNARPGSSAATAAEIAAKSEAIARAEAKVNSSGLDWGRLPVAVRKRMADLARNATEFEKLTPEMVQRAAQFEALPVPVKGTKGQLTRDPVQLRTEKNLSQTEAGAPIENRYVEQNKALLDNMTVLETKGSAKAKTAEEVGKQVTEKALAKKRDEAYAKVRDAYIKADRSAEGAEKVSPYPLIDYVRDHPNAAAVDWVVSRLKKNQVVGGVDDLGQPQVTRDISLRELSELRKTAERVGKSGGEGSGWAAEVKGVIDKMSEGAGGKEYAAARQAFKDYKSEFDNQGAVRQLLATKGGKYSTDPQVALEDVFDKTVVKGSVQDLRNVRDSLLDAENKGTRKQGRKALNDLAAQTVRYIREEATKGVTDSTGAPEVSAPKLKAAVERIGDEKLDLLLGKTSADQLRAVVNATQDLKTSPPRRIAGSDTSVNILTMLDKLMDHLPIVGPVAKGAAKMGKKAYDTGRADMAADQALLENAYTSPYRLSDQTELRAFLPGAAAAAVGEQARR